MTKDLMKELIILTKKDKIEWHIKPQISKTIYRFENKKWIELRKSLDLIPIYSLYYDYNCYYKGRIAGRRLWNAVEMSINSMLAKELIEKARLVDK